MVELAQLLFERRELCPCLIQEETLVLKIQFRRPTCLTAFFGNGKLPALGRQEILQDGDLRAQRSLPDGGTHNIGRKGLAGRFQLEPLIINFCLEPLESTPVPAEQIERVGNGHRRVKQAERIGIRD